MFAVSRRKHESQCVIFWCEYLLLTRSCCFHETAGARRYQTRNILKEQDTKHSKSETVYKKMHSGLHTEENTIKKESECVWRPAISLVPLTWQPSVNTIFLFQQFMAGL